MKRVLQLTVASFVAVALWTASNLTVSAQSGGGTIEGHAGVGRARVVENFGTTPIRGIDADHHGNLYFTVVGVNEVRMRRPDASYHTLASCGEVSEGFGALDVQLGFGDGGQLADIFVAVDGDAGGSGPGGVYRLTRDGLEPIPGNRRARVP